VIFTKGLNTGKTRLFGVYFYISIAMKRPSLLLTYISTIVITLMLISAGCGKKAKPGVPSDTGNVSAPVAAEIPKTVTVETPTYAVETSRTPAKTGNRQLNVTARLGSRDVRGGFSIPGNLVNQSLTFNWSAVRDAIDYKATVLIHRTATRTDSVARITPEEAFTGNNTFFTIPEVRPDKQYGFTVTAYDGNGNKLAEENVNFRTERAPSPVPREAIYFNGPGTTPKEMRNAAKRITVPVWKVDKNGKKYESTLNVTVHKALADVVLAVFTEIYKGREQFPIYELGGAREDSGDHGLGLAIDINARENWYKSRDGKRVVGQFWKPYENQYSITPYGDVVTAFERRGFAWGGDAWPNNFDYMHFFFSPGTWPSSPD